jgi:hypothetical protein
MPSIQNGQLFIGPTQIVVPAPTPYKRQTFLEHAFPSADCDWVVGNARLSHRYFFWFGKISRIPIKRQ